MRHQLHSRWDNHHDDDQSKISNVLFQGLAVQARERWTATLEKALVCSLRVLPLLLQGAQRGQGVRLHLAALLHHQPAVERRRGVPQVRLQSGAREHAHLLLCRGDEGRDDPVDEQSQPRLHPTEREQAETRVACKRTGTSRFTAQPHIAAQYGPWTADEGTRPAPAATSWRG